jgi:glycosyltransferase involved in cell wall biosynthesis
MKILMLGSKEYPFGVSAGHDPKAGGGIEFHVEKLSKYLARHGHDVFVITRHFPGQPGKESQGKVHIYRTVYIHNRYLRAFSLNLFGFFRAFLLVRKHRIDIIHSHAAMAGFFGTVLSRLTGRPMVFTPHGINVDLAFPAREAVRSLLRVSVRGATRILFISKVARDALSPVIKAPHALLTNAIDLEDYEYNSRSHRETRFLFLGRLEDIKGVDTLIEAFSLLLGKFPRAMLMIAGKGASKNRVIDLILQKKTGRIRYLGWVDSRKALRDADVFVRPSREKGQPVALLEAMASGKIIITSLPYIKPGRTGIACRAGDPEDLYKKMLMVCRNPGRYRKLGMQARRESRSFTWDFVSTLFEREYEQALKTPSKRS